MAQCQTCKGERYVPMMIQSPETLTLVVHPTFKAPCYRCGGSGIEPCCDGEDRWQMEHVKGGGHAHESQKK